MTEVGSQRSDDGDQRSGLRELGPGVVLLVAELCRGYRCEMEKVENGTALDVVTSYNVHSAPKIPGFRPIKDLSL